MNELHERRSKLKMKEAEVTTPKRKCELMVRESLAAMDPSNQHGSICERLDSFTDATLLKVISLAHQKLVSVSLETCNLDLWDSEKFQGFIDITLSAFNDASTSEWREGVVQNAYCALSVYQRALGQAAYHHLVIYTFPDGTPRKYAETPEDEADF